MHHCKACKSVTGLDTCPSEDRNALELKTFSNNSEAQNESNGDDRSVEVYFIKNEPDTWGLQTSSCRFPVSSSNTCDSMKTIEEVTEQETCYPAYRTSFSRSSTSSSIKDKFLNLIGMCFWNCSAGCQKMPTMD